MRSSFALQRGKGNSFKVARYLWFYWLYTRCLIMTLHDPTYWFEKQWQTDNKVLTMLTFMMFSFWIPRDIVSLHSVSSVIWSTVCMRNYLMWMRTGTGLTANLTSEDVTSYLEWLRLSTQLCFSAVPPHLWQIPTCLIVRSIDLQPVFLQISKKLQEQMSNWNQAFAHDVVHCGCKVSKTFFEIHF